MSSEYLFNVDGKLVHKLIILFNTEECTPQQLLHLQNFLCSFGTLVDYQHRVLHTGQLAYFVEYNDASAAADARDALLEHHEFKPFLVDFAYPQRRIHSQAQKNCKKLMNHTFAAQNHRSRSRSPVRIYLRGRGRNRSVSQPPLPLPPPSPPLPPRNSFSKSHSPSHSRSRSPCRDEYGRDIPTTEHRSRGRTRTRTRDASCHKRHGSYSRVLSEHWYDDDCSRLRSCSPS